MNIREKPEGRCCWRDCFEPTSFDIQAPGCVDLEVCIDHVGQVLMESAMRGWSGVRPQRWEVLMIEFNTIYAQAEDG